MADHARLPWRVDANHPEMVLDADGDLVVNCGARPSIPLERARANAALIVLAVTGRSLGLTALTTAALALRSYQYGNSAPHLAQEIADACEATAAELEVA